jgi:hypothetical protein
MNLICSFSWYSVQVPGCGKQVAAISKCAVIINPIAFLFQECYVCLIQCVYVVVFWWWDVEVAASCLAGTLTSRYNQEAELQ